MRSRLQRIAFDVTPLRESRDFRLLEIGLAASALGAQGVMVALPYQIYVLSHSATLVGLMGLFEVGPIVVVSLVGGVIADRHDRRLVLALAKLGGSVATGLLFALTTVVHRPPVIAILALGGLLAVFYTLSFVARSAILPNVIGAERLRAGLALDFGVSRAAGVIGPGAAGILIGLLGVRWIYLIDAAACVALICAAVAITPQRPVEATAHPRVRRSLTEGLRFVHANGVLAGSFVLDLNAMLFAMPRALFAVLSLSVYHTGAGGTGLLYTALAAGGVVAVLGSGWLAHVNRLGRVMIAMVLLWAMAIGAIGLTRSIVLATALLVIAGWADTISVVCGRTIFQTLTPDALRGRVSSVIGVLGAGPHLGDVESGLVAGLTGALGSVLIGGVACILGVGATVLAFPRLVAYRADT